MTTGRINQVTVEQRRSSVGPVLGGPLSRAPFGRRTLARVSRTRDFAVSVATRPGLAAGGLTGPRRRAHGPSLRHLRHHLQALSPFGVDLGRTIRPVRPSSGQSDSLLGPKSPHNVGSLLAGGLNHSQHSACWTAVKTAHSRGGTKVAFPNAEWAPLTQAVTHLHHWTHLRHVERDSLSPHI